MKDWIVESRAVCHMCNDVKLFVELHILEQPLEVTLGNGCAVQATGQGTVVLEMHQQVAKQVDMNYMMFCICLICGTTCLVCQRL